MLAVEYCVVTHQGGPAWRPVKCASAGRICQTLCGGRSTAQPTWGTPRSKVSIEYRGNDCNPTGRLLPRQMGDRCPAYGTAATN